MKCDEIREWLIADHADQANAEMDPDVASHLKECAGCRAFQRQLEEELLQPLREARVSAPESVWLNIKDAIIRREMERPVPQMDFLAGLLALLRPAYAGTLAMALLLGIFGLYLPYRNMRIVDNYLTSQVEYMVELSSHSQDNGLQYTDFGTSIEEFLL